VRRTVPPSAEIEAQIDQLLAVGAGENPRESLSELARLGARLIIQRAVEDEFDAWLGRARYERRPDYQRGLRNYESGLRNGFRPRTLQTAEGELEVEIPQVREAAETFASKLFPRGTKLVRTEPLKALVVGAFVRGLSMRRSSRCARRPGWGSSRSQPPGQPRRLPSASNQRVLDMGGAAVETLVDRRPIRPSSPSSGGL
jgi:putative transposase